MKVKGHDYARVINSSACAGKRDQSHDYFAYYMTSEEKPPTQIAQHLSGRPKGVEEI